MSEEKVLLSPSPSLAQSPTPHYSVRRVLGNLFRALTGAYGVNLILFLMLRSVIGESWSLIAMFNSVLHLMLIPALVLFPICLLSRRWLLSLTLVPAVVTFLASYAVFFLPNTAPPADAPQFKLLTYNLHAEAQILDPMVDIIRQSDADIVALQELSPPAARRFAAEFEDEYPYHALHPNTDNGIWGQGILSRFPIEDSDYWKIHLGHQRAQLNVNGTTLVLYNVHPIQPLVSSSGYAMRAEEIHFVLEKVASETAAVMFTGDFNMNDQSEDYGRMTARYHDAYRESGWGMGFTWPSIGDTALPGARFFPPLLRLDYVFLSDALQAVEARVWHTSGGSDHRPLWVKLALVG